MLPKLPVLLVLVGPDISSVLRADYTYPARGGGRETPRAKAGPAVG